MPLASRGRMAKAMLSRNHRERRSRQGPCPSSPCGCCPRGRRDEQPSLLGVVSRPTCRAVVSSLPSLMYACRMVPSPAPAYAVLRVHAKKAKTMASIAAASEHHMQTEPSPHHDPNAGPPIVLHLAAGKTPYQAAQHLLHGVERRNRETVLCREVVLSASPSYFRPGREDQAGVFDHDRMKAWTVAMLAWVKRQWPDQVASIVLHTERESTPHAHVLIVPRVRAANGWKLNSKALFDRARLRELQSSYADALAPLGIRRGEPGSEARHSEVKQFYGMVQAAKHMPELAPLPPAPKAPMPPAKLSHRLWDGVLGMLDIDSEHDRAMSAHREQLAQWREQVRQVREKNERAWRSMQAAASIAPLVARRRETPSTHRVSTTPSSPRPRMK